MVNSSILCETFRGEASKHQGSYGRVSINIQEQFMEILCVRLTTSFLTKTGHRSVLRRGLVSMSEWTLISLSQDVFSTEIYKLVRMHLEEIKSHENPYFPKKSSNFKLCNEIQVKNSSFSWIGVIDAKQFLIFFLAQVNKHWSENSFFSWPFDLFCQCK